MFRLNAPVDIRAKVKEIQTNVAVYSHALLRYDTHHQRSKVSEDCSSLISSV